MDLTRTVSLHAARELCDAALRAHPMHRSLWMMSSDLEEETKRPSAAGPNFRGNTGGSGHALSVPPAQSSARGTQEMVAAAMAARGLMQ